MKRTKVFLLYLLIPVFSWAQDSWEFYLDTYNKATSGQERLTAMDSILAHSFRKNDSIFIDFSFKYVSLAKQLEQYESAAKKAMNLSHIINAANRPEEGIQLINDVLLHKQHIKDSFLLGGLYLKRGGGFFRTDLNKALDDYTTAIANFGKADSIYVADAYLFRGQANVSLGNFIDASNDYNTASIYFESLEDYEYMQHARTGNIMMFSMNGFYDKAAAERSKSLEKLKALGLENYFATLHYNQAIDDRKVNKRQQAFLALLEAEKYLDVSISKNNMFFAVHGLLSTHYMEEGNQRKSQFHLQLIEDKYNSGKKDLITASHYNSAKAFFLSRTGAYQEALKFAQKKLENAKMIGNEEEIVHALQSMYEIHEFMGNSAQSLAYYKAYNTKKDSLFNINKTNALLYYQTLYETEKQQHEIETQNANIALLEKDNDYFKKGIALIGVLSLLVIGVFYLVREQRDLKRTQKMQQQYSQDLLISQENERKRIAKELHDGLGQNLLLIKNKLFANKNTQSSEMVSDAIEEVRSISRALHPFQLSDLGLTKAIENMIVQIDQNTTLFISSELDNIDGLFSKEEELNIYRIIQESFNNIIKHSQAEASKIKITNNQDRLEISIQDNGKGFNFAEKYQDIKSLGLKTLKERTRFLKGVMKISSDAGSGTRLDFKIPMA